MKKLLFLLIFIPFIGLSQPIYKFGTSHYANREFNSYSGMWNTWSDWKPTDLLIVMNTDSRIITIYSVDSQEYDIIDTSESIQKEEYTQYDMAAIDEDGLRCNISLLNYYDSEYDSQLIIRWSNIQIAYTLISR